MTFQCYKLLILFLSTTLAVPLPNIHAATKSTVELNTNRLSVEKSPYLLQHAHNPVDWYPWGDEAFAKARKEAKLIFLSIGYSTCHWCHVMAHESFEDAEQGLHGGLPEADGQRRLAVNHHYDTGGGTGLCRYIHTEKRQVRPVRDDNPPATGRRKMAEVS